MSPISVVGLNHYTVVYDLNSGKLRDSVVGNQSEKWKSMEACFRNICAFGMGYKRPKEYGGAEFNIPEASKVNEVKSKKDPGPCFKCGGPYFQNTHTKYTNQANNRSLSTS